MKALEQLSSQGTNRSIHWAGLKMKSIERGRRAGEKNRAAAVNTGRHLCPAVGTYSVDGNNPPHRRARRLVGHKCEQFSAIGGLLLWVYWAKLSSLDHAHGLDRSGAARTSAC